MKKIKFIPLLALISLFFSCEKLSDINENPNVPTDVPMETLLPPAEYAMANMYGRGTFTYASIFAQQIEGTNNQELNTENYNPDEFFVNNLWSDYYSGPMINLNIIIEKAVESNSPHYEGVAKVLMANCLGSLSCIWGAAPYSDALQGPNDLYPSYDPQEDIFTTIQNLLDDAITALESSESIFSPGPDDIIYNGNLQRWIQAAYSLKARYYLQTTKVNSGISSTALQMAEQGISSINGDLAYPFMGTSIDGNPIYGYYEITPNSVVDPQFIAIVDSLNDPRKPYLIAILPFTGGLTKPGPAVASIDSPLEFMSYVENLFILAECHLRDADITSAQEFLSNAVETSMKQLSEFELDQTTIDQYVNDHVQLGNDFEENLNIILTQKYIALFTQLQVWSDYRRTSYPYLYPNADGVSAANPNGQIPRRLIYPQSERILNINAPTPFPNMQDRFWWDQ
jgi:hypothetical protein